MKKLINGLVALFLIGAFLVGFRWWPHPHLSEGLPQSTLIYDEKGELLRLTLATDERYRLWVPLNDISPQLVEGVLLHEDQWFFYHVGFNPASLMRGVWQTYVAGGQRQGGSTVTMQLARLRWQLHTRDLKGKLIQVLRAIQLELSYSKREILEAYLNYAPYGGNIEGAGSASLIYFNKPAAKLTMPEALALAVLPQSPSKRQVTLNQQTTVANTHLMAARQKLLARWLEKHPQDDKYVALFELPLFMRSTTQMPFHAPHFVTQVLLQQSKYTTPETVLHTTLNLKMQKVLDEQIASFVQRHQQRGVYNASALLVDTRDMSVKALTGSADFWNVMIHGQVNGTQAKRSPGSTLKPFIYALALDQGMIHAKTILSDVPTAFGLYAPENFDQRFLGPISATEALIKSRNIPAVTLSAGLHQPDFYTFLKTAHVRLGPSSRYGLSLALGGGEVTMQELATLYAILANKGQWHPLRFLQNDPIFQGESLLSPAASFIVLRMLQQAPRPDMLQKGQPLRVPVAWKTGTSWGFRDAWTAGVVGNYVLVVWTGHFDGSSNQAFVGHDAAAPLFFAIIDHLQTVVSDLAQPLRKAPETVTDVEVCLTSGQLPSAYCPHRGKSWFIPGVSPIQVDQIYRPVIIDQETGQVACPPYHPHQTRVEVFEFWPSEWVTAFKRAGIVKKPPPTNHACTQIANVEGIPPRITVPSKTLRYVLRRSQHAQNKIALTAVTDASVKEFYWFVDGAYIGKAFAEEIFYWQPKKTGNFLLQVIDDNGKSDQRKITIEMIE